MKRIGPGRHSIRNVQVAQYGVLYPTLPKLHALVLLAESSVLKSLTIAKMCSQICFTENASEFFSDIALLLLKTAAAKGSKVAVLDSLQFEKDALSSAEWSKTKEADVQAWFRFRLLDYYNPESHHKW